MGHGMPGSVDPSANTWVCPKPGCTPKFLVVSLLMMAMDLDGTIIYGQTHLKELALADDLIASCGARCLGDRRHLTANREASSSIPNPPQSLIRVSQPSGIMISIPIIRSSFIVVSTGTHHESSSLGWFMGKSPLESRLF